MNSRQIFGAAAMLALALPAQAQDIVGKWNASIESPQGAFAMTFDFAVEGDELTGTMANDFMGETAISDGVVDGNEIAFKLSIEGGPDGAITISYTGVVEGDELTLTSTFEGGGAQGGPGEMVLTATRAKE
jgi:hypothetical protein